MALGESNTPQSIWADFWCSTKQKQIRKQSGQQQLPVRSQFKSNMDSNSSKIFSAISKSRIEEPNQIERW